MSKKLQYPEELMEAMFIADDDDAPDGAWQQLIEDAVEQYNEEKGSDFDSFEAWLYYAESNWRKERINKQN